VCESCANPGALVPGWRRRVSNITSENISDSQVQHWASSMSQPKRIDRGRIAFVLSTRERDIIAGRAFLDPELDTRLRAAVATTSGLVVELTLEEVDDLHGCVAAEASHCTDAKVQRALGAVCDRLGRLEALFTDHAPAATGVASPVAPTFTAKRGQYLAFIYYFTKIHGQAPAEADLERFFRVSPPAVHAMVLALERRGLINRMPGQARSITLRVSRRELPELE
jgi:hypothetical protein